MSAKNRTVLIFSLWFFLGLTQPPLCSAKTFGGAAKSIPIQHNGRVKSFDAFARQTVESVTNKEIWDKQQPVDLILEALYHSEAVLEMKWIRLNYGDLISNLNLDPSRYFFSYQEVIPSLDRIESLMRQSQAKRDKDIRPSKLEQETEAFYAKLVTVKHLADGDVIKVIPSAGEWLSPYESGGPEAAEFKKIVELYGQKKYEEFEKTAGAWASAAHEKSGGKFKRAVFLEIIYSDLRPFQWSWIFYLAAFVLMAGTRAPLRFLGIGFLVLAVGFHTYGLLLRILILDRPPVSNMYESMVYMSWALMVFALVFSLARRNFIFLTVGSAVSVLVMIYGNLLPIDSNLEVLVPVLRSNYWLTIHVLTVVSSYGAFGLAMGLGHRHLVLDYRKKFSKQAEDASARFIHRVIQLGVLLLGIGTVLGGVWANESWGRFWGWDPKETWALITFLAYLVVVHLKYSKLIDNFWLAMSSVLGFFFVLMTWYGVNFVLGRGLHSYGFGSGGMNWILYYLFLETAFLLFILFNKYPSKKLG